jgi:hypothetical protein
MGACHARGFLSGRERGLIGRWRWDAGDGDRLCV